MGSDAGNGVRVPDQIHRIEMGDTARCGGARASYPAMLRDVRAPRWHRQNNSESSDTRRAVEVRVKPDSPAQAVRTESSFRVANRRNSIVWLGSSCVCGFKPLMQVNHRTTNVDRELFEGRVIRSGSNSHHNVHPHTGRKHLYPDKLSETSLHQIARYCRMPEPRNNDSNSWTMPDTREMHERGNDRPNLDMRGPDALPLLSDTL